MTDQSTSDPTASGTQSESVLAIQGTSTSDYNETVVYNDDTNDPTGTPSTCGAITTGNPKYVTYGCNTRSICVGASAFGYSNLQNGDNAFSHTNVAPPSGISVLWGDPAIMGSAWTTACDGCTDVWVSNDVIPSTKLPSGCVSGGLDWHQMGGAAIYYSSDRGRTFTYLTKLTNSDDFYDGGVNDNEW